MNDERYLKGNFNLFVNAQPFMPFQLECYLFFDLINIKPFRHIEKISENVSHLEVINFGNICLLRYKQKTNVILTGHMSRFK